MTEDHIQWLWNKKLLPFPHLKLTDGSELTVVDTGLHNTAERGPDFSQAKVIYDKLQHYGDVEIHLNSSDWYQHRHDTDKRYNKVILHVVYDNDRQVYIQGKELPTLELKQWFSKSELMVKVGSDFLPKPLCSRGLSSVKRELLRQELLRSIEFKLNKKMEGIEDCSDEAKLMKLITRAFGTGFNSEGFKMLGASLDWLEFQSLTIRQKELLLLGKSTLLQPIQADDMEDLTWKRKGTRPGSFPDKRLKQLNELLSSFQMQRLMDLLNDGFALKELRRFFKIIIGKNGKQLLSPWMTDQLIINAIIPFLWQTQKAKQRFVAMRILEEMKPENNKYTRMWKHWGLEAENAFDSQGLNALFKDKCARKKCLSCSVGKKLMYDQ